MAGFDRTAATGRGGAADSKELFFHALGSGAFVDAILSAPVTTTGAIFEYEKPREVVTTIALSISRIAAAITTRTLFIPSTRSLRVFSFMPSCVPTTAQPFPGADPGATLVVAMNWVSTLPR